MKIFGISLFLLGVAWLDNVSQSVAAILVPGPLYSRTLGIRAHLLAGQQSSFLPRLLDQIEKHPHCKDVVVKKDTRDDNDKCYVEFKLNEQVWTSTAGDGSSSILPFLQQLPATKLSLVGSLVEKDLTESNSEQQRDGHSSKSDESEDTFSGMVESMVNLWRKLGNRANVEARTTFSLRTVASSSTCRRHRRRRSKNAKSDGNDDIGVNHLQHEINGASEQLCSLLSLSPCFSWIPESAKTADLSFQLSAATLDPEADSPNTTSSESQWTLELLTLTRVMPLSAGASTSGDSKNKSKHHLCRQKRLGSFVVARLANIQAGDVVLDPQCGRGTILIEAAKYWPLASKFMGVDTNMGHLEHARMNADSTLTCLELRHLPCDRRAEREGRVTNPTHGLFAAVLPSTVDKIVSSLPFGRSAAQYAVLLYSWAVCLKRGGSMTLVIDSNSLNTLSTGVQQCPLGDEGDRLFIACMQQPPIEWGAERAAIVQIRKSLWGEMDKNEDDDDSLMGESGTDSKQWQESKPRSRESFDESWATLVRSNTLPSMVPLYRARLAQSQSNKVVLANGNHHPLHDKSGGARPYNGR